MEAELDTELRKVQDAGDDDETLNLLLALKDYTEGVRVFYHRTLEALQDAASELESVDL